MSRWTIKQLNEMDDLTFAMCILSERREMLNQNAPLAKKLASAYHMLDDVRGGKPMTSGNDMWGSMRERIYREVEHAYMMKELKRHVTEENHDLQGLSPDEVLADEVIVDQIIHRFGKCEHGEDYWLAVQYAIEQGIKEVLESRVAIKGNG